MVLQFYPDPDNQPFRGLPYQEQQRAITTGEAAQVNTGRGKFKSFLQTFGKTVEAGKKTVERVPHAVDSAKNRAVRAVEPYLQDHAPEPETEAYLIPHATLQTQPGERGLWSTIWANPLDAAAGGSFSVASLADDPRTVAQAMLAYPSPHYGAQRLAYAQTAQNGAVAVPIEESEESIAGTAARGAWSILSGDVPLSELKGEIAIVCIGLVLLALGLYIAAK